MVQTNNLQFLDTMTVEQFKAEKHVETIQVKRNPKTGKLFFTFGAKTGAVSSKGIPEHPMISLVQGPDGEQFYLLHNESTGGASVLATF